jgi:hypothetical protein
MSELSEPISLTPEEAQETAQSWVQWRTALLKGRNERREEYGLPPMPAERAQRFVQPPTELEAYIFNGYRDRKDRGSAEEEMMKLLLEAYGDAEEWQNVDPARDPPGRPGGPPPGGLYASFGRRTPRRNILGIGAMRRPRRDDSDDDGIMREVVRRRDPRGRGAGAPDVGWLPNLGAFPGDMAGFGGVGRGRGGMEGRGGMGGGMGGRRGR